jgi:hypothetical protein
MTYFNILLNLLNVEMTQDSNWTGARRGPPNHEWKNLKY